MNKQDLTRMNLQNANFYGADRQLNQLMEECSELIQAVNKWKRFYFFDEVTWNPIHTVMEEVADVEMMLEQVRYLLNLNEETINDIKISKVKRERNRIMMKVSEQNETNRRR